MSARPLRQEAGMPALTQKKRPGKFRQPDEPTDEEPSYSDKEVEKEQDMDRKDDSLRTNKSPNKKTPRVANHGVQGDEETGEELAAKKASETQQSVAPHMMFLLASTYHIGMISIIQPTFSYFVPDCRNLMYMTYVIADLVCENTHLNEICPSFFSVQLYVYVGYLYYYQILRARDSVQQGVLTREQRRALRALSSIGEPEAWPVPAPLVEFIRALGTYKSSNQVYSRVVPALPDFAGLNVTNNQNSLMAQYSQCANIQRIPPMPALIEMLRRFGANTAQFRDTDWIPIGANNRQLNATNTFLGMNDSSATGVNFQALVLSSGWIAPTEGPMNYGVIQVSSKRLTTRRWNIPEVTGNLGDLESFTRLRDTLNFEWVRNLASMAKTVCRFFPGSTTLAAIDPVSNLGSITQQSVSCDPALAASAHLWYRDRPRINTSFHAYDDTEAGRLLTRVGLATAVRVRYDASRIPIGLNDDTHESGPFFVDDAHDNQARREVFRTEGTMFEDPARRFAEQVSALYDPKPNRRS